MRESIPVLLERDAGLYSNSRIPQLLSEAKGLYEDGDVYGYLNKLVEIGGEGLSVSEYVPGLFELRFPRLTRYINRIPNPKDLSLIQALPPMGVIYGTLLLPTKVLTYLGMRIAFEIEYAKLRAEKMVEDSRNTVDE